MANADDEQYIPTLVLLFWRAGMSRSTYKRYFFRDGFGFTPVALTHAKAGHRPQGADYRAFYDTATVERVARRYFREISLFEYAF